MIETISMGFNWVEKDDVLNLNSKKIIKRFYLYFSQNGTSLAKNDLVNIPKEDIDNFVNIKSEEEIFSFRQQGRSLQFMVVFHIFMDGDGSFAGDMLNKQFCKI